MIGEEKGSVAISGRSSHKMTGLGGLSNTPKPSPIDEGPEQPDSPEVRSRETYGSIHSTKISGDFGAKLISELVWSNRKSFEKTGPPFEVDHFSRSDRLEFWLNGSCP